MTEQEMLGVVRALQEWRCYFTGDENSLTIITDHNPLAYFDSKKTLSRRLEHWVETMSRFNYKWLYRKGANNVADPISRSPALLLQAQFARLHVSHTSDARYQKGTSSTSDPICHTPYTRYGCFVGSHR